MKITKKSYEIQIENEYTSFKDDLDDMRGYRNVPEMKQSIFISISNDNQINISATGGLGPEGVKALEQALSIAKAIAHIGFNNFQLIDKTAGKES